MGTDGPLTTSPGGCLQGRTVFLGGPIQYATVKNGFDPMLATTIKTIVQKLQASGVKVRSAHVAEQFGQIDMTGQDRYVTQRDYTWAQQCEAYICLLPDDGAGRPYRSDGTCIELGWISAMGKPILIITALGVTQSFLMSGLGAIAPVLHLSLQDVEESPERLTSYLHLMLTGAVKSGA